MSRIDPLPDLIPELEHIRPGYEKTFGFVPNSVKIMQLRPAMVEGFLAIKNSVMAPKDGNTVPSELKSLISNISSKAGGCQYCQAHTMHTASRKGIEEQRLEALWDFRTSDLFDEKERVTLEFALAAGSVPNGVTNELFEEMKTHWNEGEIVEIIGVVALYSFLNRFNDSLATPLEAEAASHADKLLGDKGWEIGKHAR